jgi:carbon storage regulator
MLVVTRKLGEQIVLPSCDVIVQVVSVSGNRVKLGINAPSDVPVHRKEVWCRISAEGDAGTEADGNGRAGREEVRPTHQRSSVGASA